jgi:L-amino acid N-acyltransferase YncA
LAHGLTDLDGTNDVALVAATGTRRRIIGVARYSRISPTSAEVAFVVKDAHQHHGVGHQLMNRLCKNALENGIAELVAEVLPGNLGCAASLARGWLCPVLLERRRDRRAGGTHFRRQHK